MPRKPAKTTRKSASKSAAETGCMVRVLRLPNGEDLPLPAYQSPSAAGLDLVAAVGAGEAVSIDPGRRLLVPTGLALELPPGYEAQVRPRSGLALRHGITVLNSPGTIDSDYRGEVQVLLVNLGQDTITISRGDRIAQLVIAPVSHATLVEVERLAATERGAAGFGSTGVAAGAAKRAPSPRTSAPRSRATPRTRA